MPVAKPRIQCGVCFEVFAPSSLRRLKTTGKRVCRACYDEVEEAEVPKPPAEAALKWYVLYVEIDKDKEVVKTLKRQAAIESREKDIPNVIAATHKVTEYKEGKAKVKDKLSFPGYVMVECRWSESMHHFITSTRGVFGVLPLKPQLFGTRYNRKEPPKLRKPMEWEKAKAVEWKPTALDSEEAARLLISQAVGKVSKDAPIAFKGGDRVTITDGPFKGMSGPVVSLIGTGKDAKATVKVVMWGRDLDVEVSPWQAKKEIK